MVKQISRLQRMSHAFIDFVCEIDNSIFIRI